MEEMYNAIAFTSPPSSSAVGGGGDRRSPDDISAFLNQFLQRSSQTTPFCSSFAAPSSVPPGIGRGVAGEGAFCLDSAGKASGNARGNTASFSVSGNETDEYDCESEEGLEALVEEVPAKPEAARSSLKRSRAAEVHNLSEKRRRSRINEKMKALQNLIPNSNKTDKASMLDEAIEYLKQLQLQVQMLSLRNGVSLHPMCLPRFLQPIQRSQLSGIFHEENRSQPMSIIESVLLNPGNTEHTLYDLPNQSTVSNQLSLPNMSTILNPETSLGIDSTVRPQFNPFLHPEPSVNNEYGVVPPVSLQGTRAGRSDEIKMDKHQTRSLF